MQLNVQELIEQVRRLKPVILGRELASDVSIKGFGDYVTQVDLKVQETLVGFLKERYPEAAVLAEESHRRVADLSKPTFILDPIDGTTNLVKDYRHSAVSLAFCLEGQLVFGVVYNPFSDELFFAQRGTGAFLNDKPIHVSAEEQMENSLIAFGTSPYHRENAGQEFQKICEVFLQAADVRRSGSAALDLCYVACGRTEGFFEPNLKPWDYAAGSLILHEAGGEATTYTGGPLPLLEQSGVVAANPAILPKLILLLNN